MSERMVVVCDVCGEPAAESVRIRLDARTLEKDLCAVHLDELTQAPDRPDGGPSGPR